MWIRYNFCLFALSAVFSHPAHSSENANSTDSVAFSYRSLLQFALSPPQLDRLKLSQEKKDSIISAMLQARASVPPIDDELMQEGGFERFLANMSLAAGVVEIDLREIWTTEFSEVQQKTVMGAYLGSYGLRALKSPALQEYFGLSKSQTIKLDKVLNSAVEVDRKRWQSRDKEELPAKFMRMQNRLGLAETILNRDQMMSLIDLVNDPKAQFSVKFTLGF